MNDAVSAGKRCVALFGGSFDPIHTGHLELAAAALGQRGLDGVIFVPAARQPHKHGPPQASGEHRLAMIRLAIEGNPRLSVSDCEVRRTGQSYTVDTLRAFRAEMPENTALFFLVGSDSVADLPRWKNAKELLGLCTVLVAARPGWPVEELDKLVGLASPVQIAAMKDLAIRTTANPASATEIRKLLAAGKPVTGLVPERVAAYIGKYGLYSPA